MDRRTKIVCTLGPASSDLDTIRALIEAGMDVARLNFSHGTHEEHRQRAERVRQAAQDLGRNVSILQDLQGPKIRVGELEGGEVQLTEGDTFVLTNEPMTGTAERAYVSYPTLTEDADVGGHILLDDGLLELEITAIRKAANEVETVVREGGPLRSRKGVNLPDIRTTTPSLTEKDLKDLDFGLNLDVDLVALSFVRSREDVQRLAERVDASGTDVGLIAKIEKPEAVRTIDGILDEVLGIMVARGDLGIEMPMAQMPGTQKRLINKAMGRARPVITATQMLESMVDNPRPTRAEASDVANAVLDGSDALMLSAETAVGDHPPRVVEAMDRIIRQAEEYRHESRHSLDQTPGRLEQTEDVTESVSFTASRLAEQVGAAAIACLTNSGTTARNIARHRPSMPIYAFTDNERVVGKLGVLWGTKAFHIPFEQDTDRGIARVHSVLSENGFIAPGELIVITAGMPLPARGRTNMVHVSRIH
jgi:pyruvate kinase